MKKKKIVITLCVTIILMLGVTLTALASGGTLAFDISGPDLVKQGEIINLKVNANEAGLTDGKATITYDESKLTYQGSKLAYSTEENQLEFVVNSEESGKLVVVWATVNPLEASGTVFTLDFSSSKSAEYGQATEVKFEVEYANDSEGNSIAMATDKDKDSINIQIGDKTPGPGPNPDPDPDPNPNPNPDPNPDPKPESGSNSGTDKPNKGEEDAKLPSTGGFIPFTRYLAITFIVAVVIFEFVSRYRRKGEKS